MPRLQELVLWSKVYNLRLRTETCLNGSPIAKLWSRSIFVFSCLHRHVYNVLASAFCTEGIILPPLHVFSKRPLLHKWSCCLNSARETVTQVSARFWATPTLHQQPKVCVLCMSVCLGIGCILQKQGCHWTFAKITENLRVRAVSQKMNTKRDRKFRKWEMK